MSKIIITGATGTAGSEAVRQALLHPSISQVFVLTRRPLPSHITPSPPSPKLTVIEHADFLSYPPDLIQKLEGADGVIWDLGVSSIGYKEADYKVITEDYTLAAAKAFAGIKRDESKGKFVFAFLSGRSVNQDLNGPLFSRSKGRAEIALAEFRNTYPSITTYSFRAGGIQPVQPIPEAPLVTKIATRTLLPALGLMSSNIINKTDLLARAMIEAIIRGGSGDIDGWKGKGELGNPNAFTPAEINTLAKDSVLNN